MLMLIPSVLADWSIRANEDLPKYGISDFRLNLHSNGDKGSGSISYNIDGTQISMSLKQTRVHKNFYSYDAKVTTRNLETREHSKEETRFGLWYDTGENFIYIKGMEIPVRRLR